MDYSVFKKLPNIELVLLERLGVLSQSSEIVNIEITPKYVSSGSDIINGYFVFDWDFEEKYFSILNIEPKSIRVVTNNDIENLCSEKAIVFSASKPLNNLWSLIRFDSKIIAKYGSKTTDFEVEDVVILGINSLRKKVAIGGGFYGTAEKISSREVYVLAELEMLCIKKGIENKPMHIRLLAEGYSLLKFGDLKLGYFIIFTAIESYINFIIDGSLLREHLDDKLIKAYKIGYDCLNKILFPCKHQIFEVLKGIKQYTPERNATAHGGWSDVRIKECRDLLIFASVLMTSYDADLCNFDDLKDYLY